jgi:hypothetical protein
MQCAWNVKGQLWSTKVGFSAVFHAINGFVKTTNSSIRHHVNKLRARLSIAYLAIGLVYTPAYVARSVSVMTMLKVLPT